MKDLTLFTGIVVNQILDVKRLHNGAMELIAQWPILGGQLLTNACTLTLSHSKSS